ncbi:single-strand DNA-binding protein [Bifidobacterium commune]|uniref:Single-strand DNA-binding protein n=2 Tax=Bifidobacterium commune TaxID=1505727 RepID=A0A1C4H3P3_9BIFI|nr:single-strand DNA-binding protein [Bifidobacterium commune]
MEGVEMAQQGVATISGFMGTDPQSFGKEGGVTACSFRVGCTPRYFNAVANKWRDRPTTWITVKVFRTLAKNVLSSLRKGDPVVVTGALATEEWEHDGTKRSKIVMEATSVGHDLNFGISVFQRDKPNLGEPEGGDMHPDDGVVDSDLNDNEQTLSRRKNNDPWDASVVFEQPDTVSGQPAASES